jgi:hypothetical protein
VNTEHSLEWQFGGWHNLNPLVGWSILLVVGVATILSEHAEKADVATASHSGGVALRIFAGARGLPSGASAGGTRL